MAKREYYCEECQGSFKCKDKGEGFVDFCPTCNVLHYFRTKKGAGYFRR